MGTEPDVTTFSYNEDRQLIRIVVPGNTTVDFNYDAAGNIINITLPEGQIIYTYDASTGNTVGIESPDGLKLSYEYDGDLVIKETLEGSIAGSVETSYYNDFRVKSLSINGADKVDLIYDVDGNTIKAGELSIIRDNENDLITRTLFGEIQTRETRDEFSILASFKAAFGISELFSKSYARDDTGRITNTIETIQGETISRDYVYDTGGRLVQV